MTQARNDNRSAQLPRAPVASHAHQAPEALSDPTAATDCDRYERLAARRPSIKALIAVSMGNTRDGDRALLQRAQARYAAILSTKRRAPKVPYLEPDTALRIARALSRFSTGIAPN